jgi:xylan 1,4-beta-xylosidase
MNTLVDEFSVEQVKTWQFRMGTEPDLYPNHWNGTREQYFKHYDLTVDAVTQVVPGVVIGPGNILNPTHKFWLPAGERTEQIDYELSELVGTGRGWGLSLIDHAVMGVNSATGKKGTQMDYFAFSYYDAVGGERPILLEESIRRVRTHLSKYPETRDLPIGIHEFGILHDENRKRLWGNDITEWGASWYAVISDIVYRNNVQEVYEWSTTTNSFPHPRTQVMQMLEMMAEGERIEVNSTGEVDGYAGALASVKNDKIYILLYNHHTARIPKVSNTISFKVEGSEITENKKWSMNEWSIDRDHGVWVYEMYEDLVKAGIEPEPGSPIYDGSLRERFGSNWKGVFDENRAKYEKMAEFPLTTKEKPVLLREGAINMKYQMPGHSVRLIELTPVK